MAAEPSPAAPRGDGAARSADSLQQQVLRVQEGVDALLQRFDDKLLHDEARSNEIRRLSAELEKHQPDVQWRTARPFVVQMIEHVGEILRFARSYEASADQPAVKDFLDVLESLREGIELALEEHGITAYRPRAGSDTFDPRRHSVVGKPIPTGDPGLSRLVERCICPGFERAGEVVARAAVRIYRYDEEQGAQ